MLTLSLLFAAGLLAGFFDSICGGGGLISVPALLMTGISPIQALACNKCQSIFGSGTASFRFWLHKQFKIKEVLPHFLLSMAGAILGTLLIKQLSADFLSQLIPILTLFMAAYFWFSPSLKIEETRKAKLSSLAFGLTTVLAIGFYDGFFGPGTGSFFTVALIILMGLSLKQAAIRARIYNFGSNLGSFFVFLFSGLIIFKYALVMACGQMIGAWIGSKLVLNHGQKLIRPLIVAICLILSIKLLLF